METRRPYVDLVYMGKFNERVGGRFIINMTHSVACLLITSPALITLSDSSYFF